MSRLRKKIGGVNSTSPPKTRPSRSSRSSRSQEVKINAPTTRRQTRRQTNQFIENLSQDQLKTIIRLQKYMKNKIETRKKLKKKQERLQQARQTRIKLNKTVIEKIPKETEMLKQILESIFLANNIKNTSDIENYLIKLTYFLPESETYIYNIKLSLDIIYNDYITYSVKLNRNLSSLSHHEDMIRNNSPDRPGPLSDRQIKTISSDIEIIEDKLSQIKSVFINIQRLLNKLFRLLSISDTKMTKYTSNILQIKIDDSGDINVQENKKNFTRKTSDFFDKIIYKLKKIHEFPNIIDKIDKINTIFTNIQEFLQEYAEQNQTRKSKSEPRTSRAKPRK